MKKQVEILTQHNFLKIKKSKPENCVLNVRKQRQKSANKTKNIYVEFN